MPDFPSGPLLNHQRYHVERRGDAGLFYFHRGTAHFDALPSSSDPDEQVRVQLKSINYQVFQEDLGESFPDYVDRRRQELRTEADLLAAYHEITAHVPQIFDLVDGSNQWDAQVAACGKQDGEPCLVLEELNATPLTRFQDPLSQQEVSELAEKILMLLRVFHSSTRACPKRRYYISLTPDDILLERDTFDCWFRNLWKLKTKKQLQNEAIHLDPGLNAFVSPVVAWRLTPCPNYSQVDPAGISADALDLYSVGVILYFLLADEPDLTRELPGFLTPQRLDTFAQSRGLLPEMKLLLGNLVQHRYKSAQDALDDLCDMRKKLRHDPFRAPPPPALPPPDRYNDDEVIPRGETIAGRYEVIQLLAVGGQGFVYLGEDRRTRSKVILKLMRYSDNVRSDKKLDWGDFVRLRRDECLHEARLALRAHARTDSVPQLLDVAYTTSRDPNISSHSDPQISGPHEPVLVFEFIAGTPVEVAKVDDEAELLRFVHGICGMLSRLHREEGGLFYLYVDWKPANIVRHPETGNYTIVDLGAIVLIRNGQGEYDEIFSTDPYAGWEEFNLDGTLNKQLTASYDLHGLAGVAWYLATDAVRDADEMDRLATEVGKYQKDNPRPPAPILSPQRLPAKYAGLKNILGKALAVQAKDRYQSAEEMASAAIALLGTASSNPPQAPLKLEASASAGGQVELVCRLPLDNFCQKVLIRRDAKPLSGASDGQVICEEEIRSTNLGKSISWRDTVDSSWPEAHYAAYSIGYNGQASAARSCAVPLVVDPTLKPIVRDELSVILRWEVPEVVRRNGGEVVVEALDGNRREIYAGLDAQLRVPSLKPTQEYRFRVFSRLPYGESDGTEVSGRPLPKLAHLEHVEAVGGDKQITVKWRMQPAAADEVIFLRSQSPLEKEDIAVGHKRARFAPVKFKLDEDYRVIGAEPAANAGLKQLPDGRLEGWWTDTTAVPGLRYFYTPVLSYHEVTEPWMEPAADGISFVEATEFAAVALPAAVRLRWSLPERVTRVRIERLTPNKQVEKTWEPPTEHTTLLDEGLAPAREVTHRIRLQYGSQWSQGREITCVPLAPIEFLPPDAPLTTTAEVRNIKMEAVGDSLLINWQAPEEAAAVIVSLAPSARQVVVPAADERCRFDALPPADYVATIRTVSKEGDVSSGASSNLVSLTADVDESIVVEEVLA